MRKYFILCCLFFCLILTSCKKQIVVKVYEGDEIVAQSFLNKGDNYKLPEFPCDEGFYYKFDIDSDKLINLQSDLVITVCKVEKSKQCLFYKDDLLIKESIILYTTNPEYPELSPEIKVLKWNIEDVSEGDNYIYKYTLEYEINTFLVSFYNQDDEFLYEEMVQYGAQAKGPTIPDNMKVQWDKTFDDITEDTIVQGIITKKYATITYYEDGLLANLAPATYQVGEEMDLPKLQKEGYDFIGWFISDISLYNYQKIYANMSSDLTLYARFKKIVKEEIVLPEATYHFTGIKKTAHSSGNGTYVYQPIMPEGVNQSVTLYDWQILDQTIATVSSYSSISAKKAGYTILTASQKSDKTVTINCLIKVTSQGIEFGDLTEANTNITFKVKFIGINEEIIDEQIVNKGDTAFYPIPPIIPNMAFLGWDSEPFNITSDTTIKALYEEGVNIYTSCKFSLMGDSISTFQDYIPKGYACFYPYPTADIFDVNQTWWMQVVNKLGAGMFLNNSYSGSCVAAGGSSDSQNTTRISKLFFGEENPDYLLIYMGSNDAASSSISQESFKKGYKAMLDKLTSKSKTMKIILCTLPISKLYSSLRQTQINEVIKEMALIYNLPLIDMAEFDLSPYLIDSAHPNYLGMTKLAEYIVKELKKLN